MASSSNLLAYKIVFTILGLFMLATLIYTIITDGSPFRSDVLSPWLITTVIDFYVNVVAIVVWVAYKESSWINVLLWIILLVCFGSITTCAYVVKTLFISSQGPGHDPLEFVIFRKGSQLKIKCCSLLILRVVFSVLAVFMLLAVIYTVATDGLPFRKELLTPWMAATLIDFYINVTAISVWVIHMESTWIGAIFWICLLICFGSIATCAYIAIQLFKLSDRNPTYHVLLDCPAK